MTFPGERFASLADHAAWHARHTLALQDRGHVERAPPVGGSCAPCLRATGFASGRCSCPDRLDASARALLHAAIAEGGLRRWSRLSLPQTDGVVSDRLAALAGRLVPLEAGEADLVAIHRWRGVPALAAARRALVAGGCLLASLAFDPEVLRTQPDGRLGWDLLDLARAAGFARAELLRPWSRELGYLGSELFLLKAVA